MNSVVFTNDSCTQVYLHWDAMRKKRTNYTASCCRCLDWTMHNDVVLSISLQWYEKTTWKLMPYGQPAALPSTSKVKQWLMLKKCLLASHLTQSIIKIQHLFVNVSSKGHKTVYLLYIPLQTCPFDPAVERCWTYCFQELHNKLTFFPLICVIHHFGEFWL